ncbi:iron chaperone [Mangrovibacillus cuniculi]|uniref:DUF1801 domain-containing protein n=1 Tax=Mangrovibacillus cuniculi TaxID=2593652 RepID=A0A7S8C8X6_9BACI|nr:DUF1801 domain-containing protein [Mangrovibacillus cuniculi]QPC45554.1 DUF1801 domain-containing protein [Mangrovibacillus cuniculi]
MQYDVSTPHEYIEVLEHDWRKDKLLAIRELIQTLAPELEEGIQYKMLAFGKGNDYLFHLNAQKNYVSLYVGNIEKVDPTQQLLEGFNVGKGCIRLKKSNDITSSNLPAFIEKAIALWRNGIDTSC